MRLLFIFFLFITAFFFINTPTIYAKESTESAMPKVDYILPHPGMLPDHRFYKLKVLRDKLIPLFISSPQKKIEFYLLQADKGIAATERLIKKDNIDLAKETALKAEHNYTTLTYIVKSNKWSFSDKEYNKLYSAAQKHQEILSTIIASVPKNQQKTFQTVLYFSQQNEKEIRNTQKSLTK